MGGNKGASRVAPLARVEGCDTWRLLGGGSEIGDDKVKAARMIQSRCNLDSGAQHWVIGCDGRWKDGRWAGRMDGQRDGRTDRQRDGRTDGWTGRRSLEDGVFQEGQAFVGKLVDIEVRRLSMRRFWSFLCLVF
ncbi:hypothetical protein KC19_1G042100 [Ceratodon purpureus]|uniref:Uncharacterized protein n=1 Tax=Ceratodon purpureus TaxID=3225 RepID=A0A8T0J3L6_CERPU|nr:hypothetical protein KC19_1G042100 [Ceratodon purpureus]